MPVCWFGEGGDGTAREHDDVDAELGQAAPLAGTEALAQANQQQQRGHAPGDAEHGEERPQLVGGDGVEDLREDVEKGAHGGVRWSACSLDGSTQFHTRQFPGDWFSSMRDTESDAVLR